MLQLEGRGRGRQTQAIPIRLVLLCYKGNVTTVNIA